MDLEALAEMIGCTVMRSEPVSGHWGEYDASAHEIRLHPRLHGAQARSVLAHELGHAAHRHESSTARTEREADAFSDWVQIPLCMFLRAVQVQESMQAVACELGVLPADARRYAERLVTKK